MFLTLSAFNTLYQFWIHTRAIGRLGPLEWVLNTPSHHRVHHALQPEVHRPQLRGHADRLGPPVRHLQGGGDEPVYGITKPLQSWNPVWANLHVWVDLFRQGASHRRDWPTGCGCSCGPPGWQPAELGGFEPPPEVERATYRKFETPLPRALALYAFAQFLLVLLGTTALLFRQQEMAPSMRALGALAAILSLVSVGGLLERKPWAHALEWVRSAALPIAAWLATGSVAAAIAFGLAGLGSALWLARYGRLFGRGRAEAQTAA